eukprot:1821386-Alexandrium_andersonii.AAC.1
MAPRAEGALPSLAPDGHHSIEFSDASNPAASAASLNFRVLASGPPGSVSSFREFSDARIQL